MSLSSSISCLILASVALVGCGSDDSGGGNSTGGKGGTSSGGSSSGGTSSGGTSSGGTSSGGTSSGGTSSGGTSSGGTAGSTGDGGACKTCSEMVQTAESDLTKACPGTSATLIQNFVTCTCQPDVCGGAGKGCEQACKGGDVTPDCVTCDQTAAAGPCQQQFNGCMADK